MIYRDALARLANKADALQGRKAPSLRPEEQWWEAVLQDGTIQGMLPGDRIPSRLALNDARNRIPKLKYTSDMAFGLFLQKQGCLAWRTSSVRGWIFPSLNEARRSWELKFGQWVWDDPELTEWEIPQ